MATTRQPYHDGVCECDRPPGQCVKGDMDRCPLVDEIEPDDDEDDQVDDGWLLDGSWT